MSDSSGGDWHGYEPAEHPIPEPPEETPAELNDASLLGQVGTVVIAVPGGDRPGEVAVPHRGVSEIFIAYAGERLERGVEVRVTSVRGPRQVGVTPTTA